MSGAEPDRYLYRGTSPGWPGGSGARSIPMTCTSTDPLVATLFAIRARSRFGRCVVILGERTAFEDLTGPPNYMDQLESAVNLRVTPMEFERRAARMIGVDGSLEILADLGFTPLPVAFADSSDLRIGLERTLLETFRLNDRQLVAYNARVEELPHDS